MQSFTIEWVFKATARLFPDNALRSFTNFLSEELNLKFQWEIAISEIAFRSTYQIVTEGKFLFDDKKVSKSSEFYYQEPDVYRSITDIVEAMNTLLQERHNHLENYIQVKCPEERRKLTFT